ncbi:hypothetical protein EYF80_036917 [Liparis tanakae]|uniref:Uncharacterized protein n=1 Tax=Liparis tanakae TaxID=230148 RepID=A0A4Z2GJC5_9TELE|nr:hypothetical protein EYF80_036917 [Liparis tanakae]
MGNSIPRGPQKHYPHSNEVEGLACHHHNACFGRSKASGRSARARPEGPSVVVKSSSLLLPGSSSSSSSSSSSPYQVHLNNGPLCSAAAV